jgi:cytochrome P450
MEHARRPRGSRCLAEKTICRIMGLPLKDISFQPERLSGCTMITFPRVTTSTVEVMGYSLEPGTVVVGSIYLTHHREEIYPDPDRFKPEHFLERRFSAFEYLPFGGGARRCIGMTFAQFEMKLVISRIVSNFELALADKRSVRPMRRGLTAGPSQVRMVVRDSLPAVRTRAVNR